MRLAVSIPEVFTDGRADPAGIARFLRRAEELACFESVWDSEQILGRMQTMEALTLLGFAAACTERLRLGCAVLVTPLRGPVHLAKELATLDQLSLGRLEIGVGLGGRANLYPAVGLDPPARVARFTEGLQLMKALWTEPSVTFHGRFWHLEGEAMEPKPIQQPHPPIWIGGGHPNALRRAVELGTGFFGAGGATPPDFGDQVRTIRQLLEKAGRDPDSFDVAKRVFIAIDEDEDRAWRGLAERFRQRYGRAEGFEASTVWGPPAKCIEALRQLAAAGAKLVLLQPVYAEDEQLERIAAELAPSLLS